MQTSRLSIICGRTSFPGGSLKYHYSDASS
jgi:hypothetical protein